MTVGSDSAPLDTPSGRCPEIPRTVAEKAALEGTAVTPSPWAAQWWFYLLAGVFALARTARGWQRFGRHAKRISRAGDVANEDVRPNR